MIKRIKCREYKKVWSQEILHKLCFVSSKLIKKYRILYTKVRGEMEQSAESIIQWDKVSRRLIKNTAQRKHRIFQEH